MKKPESYRETIVVEASHLDEMNHVNNVQYLQWIQDIAKSHWELRAKPEWLKDFAWVAVSHHIEYKKPAFLNDELELHTYVNSFSGVKSERFVEITNKKTGALLVKSVTIWAMLHRESQKPAKPTPEMLASFNVEQ